MTLPNFLVIGAAKSGTSSVHSYLQAHPQVFTPKLKEINFFAYDGPESSGHYWAKTEQAYERHFEDAGGAIAIGEVTPSYLTSRVAPDNIRRMLPQVKLIAILRNPVDRAYSAYLMSRRTGRTALDLDAAFSSDAAGYITQGRYSTYLQRYYDRFDRRQIKVLRFEDLTSDSRAVTTELYRFLGVDSSFEPPAKVHNKGYVPRSQTLNAIAHSRLVRRVLKPMLPARVMEWARNVRSINARQPDELPPQIRAKLAEYYRDDILRLQELTEVDFSIWLSLQASPHPQATAGEAS
jgi:hypothetical protein